MLLAEKFKERDLPTATEEEVKKHIFELLERVMGPNGGRICLISELLGKTDEEFFGEEGETPKWIETDRGWALASRKDWTSVLAYVFQRDLNIDLAVEPDGSLPVTNRQDEGGCLINIVKIPGNYNGHRLAVEREEWWDKSGNLVGVSFSMVWEARENQPLNF